jgi:hypothetical protein
LGVIVIPPQKTGDEIKVIRACPHTESSIVADMTATAQGSASVNKQVGISTK